jgi:hypothetical protein
MKIEEFVKGLADRVQKEEESPVVFQYHATSTSVNGKEAVAGLILCRQNKVSKDERYDFFLKIMEQAKQENVLGDWLSYIGNNTEEVKGCAFWPKDNTTKADIKIAGLKRAIEEGRIEIDEITGKDDERFLILWLDTVYDPKLDNRSNSGSGTVLRGKVGLVLKYPDEF